MRHRSVRIGLAIVAILSSVAAGWFVVQTQREADRLAASARTFDARAQDLLAEVATLKASQRAYVAPGQGTEFWTQHVARILDSIHADLATLQQSSTAPEVTTALRSAATFTAQLGDMDARVQKGLRIGDVLMAADTIFSEGEQTTANLSHQIDLARTEVLAATDAQVGSLRHRQAAVIGSAALFGIAVLCALAFAEIRPAAAVRAEEPRLALASPVEESAPGEFSDDFGNLRFDGGDAAAPAVSAPPFPDLAAAAIVCAEIARLESTAGLPMLLERVAALLDASGVVLWSAGGSNDAELRPALSHGYPPPIVAKMTSIPSDANNVTAAAFRTQQVQIAAGDSVANGALAVPLLSPEGCVGVLTAEMRHGGESNPTLRALGSIFASQFGTVLGTAPPPAASSGVAHGGR
jgi:hypothetical protein